MLPTLKVNKSDLLNHGRTLGLSELLSALMNSGLFNIEDHNDRVKTLRGERATLLYCNDKKIYLDLWEYNSPTYTKNAYESNFDLIIKLQSKIMKDSGVERCCIRKGILTHLTPEQRLTYHKKVVPWTFFPSRLMIPYIGKEIPACSNKTFGFFCGKTWKCRGPMLNKMKEQGIEVVASSQELRSGRPLSDQEYLQKMFDSKYGIVLGGRASHLTECKNRREFDYMMMKKPLLLNYRPNYYNPMIEGKHYIYIDDKTDFSKLESLYNINEIALNGYNWYIDNGINCASVFRKIMKERLGI